MHTDQLKADWIELAQRYSDEMVLIEGLHFEMVKQYTQSNRHYHNFRHIQTMLSQVEAHAADLIDADALRFAVWFHDVVYKPIHKDNEEKSAEFAETILNLLHFPADRTQRVKELILRTKDHSIQLPEDDLDTQFLMDCDLLILGESPDQYRVYLEQIRKEYWIIPDLVYKPGRLKFLRRFLAMPVIYRTPYFQPDREAQARENLQAEIHLLS
jgi:predicted metal-dependent HD superfamily phosphohydrolase